MYIYPDRMSKVAIDNLHSPSQPRQQVMGPVYLPLRRWPSVFRLRRPSSSIYRQVPSNLSRRYLRSSSSNRFKVKFTVLPRRSVNRENSKFQVLRKFLFKLVVKSGVVGRKLLGLCSFQAQVCSLFWWKLLRSTSSSSLFWWKSVAFWKIVYWTQNDSDARACPLDLKRLRSLLV